MEKEILYQLLQEIRDEIDRNEREDGTYAFDSKQHLIPNLKAV